MPVDEEMLVNRQNRLALGAWLFDRPLTQVCGALSSCDDKAVRFSVAAGGHRLPASAGSGRVGP
jgi:hypothetical protein